MSGITSNEPVRLDFELTLDDFLEFYLRDMSPLALHQPTRVSEFLHLVGPYGWLAAIIIFSVYLFFTGRLVWNDIRPYLVFVPISWLIAYGVFTKPRKRRLEKSPRERLRELLDSKVPIAERGAHTIIVGPDFITENNAIRSTTVHTPGIGRIEVTDKYVYVNTHCALTFIIPKRVFASANDFWWFIRAVTAARHGGGVDWVCYDDDIGKAPLGFEVLPVDRMSPRAKEHRDGGV